jgi:hypothetical protein
LRRTQYMPNDTHTYMGAFGKMIHFRTSAERQCAEA